MVRVDQVNFVRQLCGGVQDQIEKNIASGKVPENWDGVELRQYIADKYAQVVIKGTMSRARKMAYNNVIITTDL